MCSAILCQLPQLVRHAFAWLRDRWLTHEFDSACSVLYTSVPRRRSTCRRSTYTRHHCATTTAAAAATTTTIGTSHGSIPLGGESCQGTTDDLLPADRAAYYRLWEALPGLSAHHPGTHCPRCGLLSLPFLFSSLFRFHHQTTFNN